MDLLLGILMGIGLSAACGFRVFLPMFIAGLAVSGGHAEVGAGFEWLGSDIALIMLGTASLLEVGAYYIPWLDHALDTVASPAAVVAGVVLTAGFLPETAPWIKWSLAVIVGGSITSTVQAATLVLRTTSTTLSGGLTNPVVSTGELGGSALASIGGLFAPVITAIILFILAVAVYQKWVKKKAGKIAAAAT
jgi:hypothetical protein